MAGRAALSGWPAAAASLALLAGCGTGGPVAGSQAPAPSATAPDLSRLEACALVPPETAAQLAGGAVTRVSSSTQGLTSLCFYASAENADGVAVFVEQIPGGGAKQVVKAALDRNATPTAKLTAVKGIGDEAGTRTEAHAAAVAFARGRLLVVLTVTSAGRSGSDLLPGLERVAKQLAAKL